MSSLGTRIKDAAADTKLLPPALPSTKKAIEEGRTVVVEAVQAGIDEYKPLTSRPLKKLTVRPTDHFPGVSLGFKKLTTFYLKYDDE